MRMWKNKGLYTPNWLRKTVERKGLEQKFFEPIVEGMFTPEQIETVVIDPPGASMRRSKRAEALLDKAWNKHVAELTKNGKPRLKNWALSSKASGMLTAQLGLNTPPTFLKNSCVKG